MCAAWRAVDVWTTFSLRYTLEHLQHYNLLLIRSFGPTVLYVECSLQPMTVSHTNEIKPVLRIRFFWTCPVRIHLFQIVKIWLNILKSQKLPDFKFVWERKLTTFPKSIEITTVCWKSVKLSYYFKYKVGFNHRSVAHQIQIDLFDLCQNQNDKQKLLAVISFLKLFSLAISLFSPVHYFHLQY